MVIPQFLSSFLHKGVRNRTKIGKKKKKKSGRNIVILYNKQQKYSSFIFIFIFLFFSPLSVLTENIIFVVGKKLGDK